MNVANAFRLVAVFGLAAALANAEGITYVCASNINAATCTYLNNTVAGNYSSAFSNANAAIYIQMGSTTDLAEYTSNFALLRYGAYVSDLTANSVASGDPVQASAVTALNQVDSNAYYADGSVLVTDALAQALGIPTADLKGTTGPADGNNACTIGTSGCYNGVITMDNTSVTWYYDQNGGTIGVDSHDFYALVEYETDEVLGTGSCMTTTAKTLDDFCDEYTDENGMPSAVDLFRYNSANSLALDESYIGLDSAPSGAYFSYDGGETNGANGYIYNTVANRDYAGFVTSCSGSLSIQDAQDCSGQEQGLTILNDGGAEVNILNAVGYDLATAPEPGTFVMVGMGLGLVGLSRRRRS